MPGYEQGGQASINVEASIRAGFMAVDEAPCPQANSQTPHLRSRQRKKTFCN
jgi:hypothetical protein